MKLNMVSGATAVALACLVSSASAAVITETHSFGPANPAFSTSLSFAPHTIVDLVGIKITLNTSAKANIFIDNTTGIDQAYTSAHAEFTVTASGPDSVNVFNNLIAFSGNGTVSPGFHVISGVEDNQSDSVIVPSTKWSSYTTGGPINVTAAAGNGYYSGSADSGVLFGGSALVSGKVTIEFEYAAVPEPSTYMAGLGALCLFGMSALKRRK